MVSISCVALLKLSLIHTSFGHYNTISLRANETDVSRLQYTLEDRETVFITDEWTEKAYRNKGFMRVLFGQLKKKNPRVRRIEGTLSMTNMEVFKYVDLEELTFERCREIVRSTPAFKLRARLGFTTIYKCDWNGQFVAFGSSK